MRFPSAPFDLRLAYSQFPDVFSIVVGHVKNDAVVSQPEVIVPNSHPDLHGLPLGCGFERSGFHPEGKRYWPSRRAVGIGEPRALIGRSRGSTFRHIRRR